MNPSLLTYLIVAYLIQNSNQAAGDVNPSTNPNGDEATQVTNSNRSEPPLANSNSNFITTESRSFFSLWGSKNTGGSAAAGSDSDSANKPKKNVDESQMIPRLITAEERDKVLKWIKENDQKAIVDFFNDRNNNNIDYPLIRFKGGDLHGYTPLAAAIRSCSIETAKVLAPAQYHARSLWTTELAPGSSPIELAVKYCPLLLVEVIEHQKKHEEYLSEKSKTVNIATGTGSTSEPEEDVPESKPHALARMTINSDHHKLANIFKYAIKHAKNGSIQADEKETILHWIADHFDDKVVISSIGNNQIKRDDANVAFKFELFIKSCIKKNIDKVEFVDFLSEKISKISTNFFRDGMLQLFHSGKSNIFVEHSDKIPATERNAIIMQAAPSLNPSEAESFTQQEVENLQTAFRALNIQTRSHKVTEAITAFNDFAREGVKELLRVVEAESQGAERIVSFLLDPTKITSVLFKNLPTFYNILLRQYPRVDFAVAVTQRVNALKNEDFKVYWTGSETLKLDFIEELIEAYKTDSVEKLQEYLVLLRESVDAHKIHFSDLRFDFAPYALSPLKAAIMLNKPNILKFLLTDKDHKQSLFVSTKFELSAVELAACYHPNIVVDHILPAVGADCKTRLKMANFLIEMFSETKLQKCHTGAKHAPIIIPAILKPANPENVKCINLKKKDLIEEAVKLRFPVNLIKAFHMIGLYKNIEYYIKMSIERGYLDLFKYFESEMGADAAANSKEMKGLLSLWIRNTSGIMNEENMAMLEYLLKRSYVDVNSYGETGMTALSIATQRSSVWIMKRLLLVKDLDVNRIDTASATPTLQIAINIFRNEPEFNDLSNESITTRIIIMFLAEFDISLNGFLLQQVRIFSESLEKVEFKEYIRELMVTPPDEADGTWSTNAIENRILSSIDPGLRPVARILSQWVVTPIKYLLDKLYTSRVNATFFIVVEVLSILRNLVTNPLISFAIQAVVPDSASYVQTFPTLLEFVEILMDEGLKSVEKITNEDLVKILGRPSANYGLPHNLLLAHPDINPVLENNMNLDSLYLSKNRAKLLAGDHAGFDEMARTHIRIRNIYPLHDSGKRTRNIIYGTITTIIVGAASAGIIRWMM